MKFLNVNNTYASYQDLITFYESNKVALFSAIHIEMRGFFAANMTAALGAILDLFAQNLNGIHFDYIDPKLELVLQKNDFLTYYGKKKVPDYNQTTIKYQKLRPSDGKFFKKYVIEELLERHTKDLPQMSLGVKEKMVEGIYEIFVNAQIHSESSFIYTCGQFFPQKHKIEFTIVDTGIGFKNKVNERFGTKLDAATAIRWAVQDKKTTKQQISGGIGLAVLKEFIEKNKGKMQIVSSDGFYQFDSGGEVSKLFQGEFPGTIVNLQFKTDDNNNYSLKSELNIHDIF